MFGYRSFLHIGALGDASIEGLLSKGFELENFSYSLSQAIGINGKAQGEVRAGSLQLTFGSLPPNEIIEWMIDPRKYKNGTIILCDINDEPLQKITFERAACTGLTINYAGATRRYASTQIVLQVKILSVSDAIVENNWNNV